MEIQIGAAKTEIGHIELAMIIRELADNERHAAFYRAFHQSESPLIRRIIAMKNCIDEETTLNFLKDKDLGVLRNIVSTEAFQKYADEDSILALLNIEDEELSINTLKNIRQEAFEERLDIDKICDMFLKSPNPAMRMALSENCDLPRKYLLKLAKDPDANVREEVNRMLGR